MAKASDIKKGLVVELDGKLLKVGDKVRIHTTDKRYVSRAD